MNAKSKHSPEKLDCNHRKSKNDDGRRNYPELSRKDIFPTDRTRDSNKPDEKNHSRVSDVKEAAKPHNQSGSDESDGERKRKRSKKKDATSDDDDDYSHDSHTEDRKEAKKRRKEEKRLKKEERRKRREERRRKKAEKQKLKTGGDVSPSSEEDDQKKLEIELREKALESLRAKKGSVGH